VLTSLGLIVLAVRDRSRRSASLRARWSHAIDSTPGTAPAFALASTGAAASRYLPPATAKRRFRRVRVRQVRAPHHPSIPANVPGPATW